MKYGIFLFSLLLVLSQSTQLTCCPCNLFNDEELKPFFEQHEQESANTTEDDEEEYDSADNHDAP